MSRLVHVIAKREVVGEREAFNWEYDTFADLLSALDCQLFSLNEDDEGLTRFETQKVSYKKALDVLKAYRKSGKLNEDDFDKAEIDNCVEKLGGIDNVIENMKGFLKESDKKCEWIIFVVW